MNEAKPKKKDNLQEYENVIMKYTTSSDLIDVVAFAEEMDIKVQKMTDPELIKKKALGSYQKIVEENGEEKSIIEWNPKEMEEGSVRFRFTIAHEIMHFLFHSDKVSKAFRIMDYQGLNTPEYLGGLEKIKIGEIRKMEKEANAFSAKLLVSDWEVAKAKARMISEWGITERRLIQDLSRKLKVSKDTASIRVFKKKYEDLD